MTIHARLAALVFALVCLASTPAAAQLVVIDAAMLAKNIAKYALDKHVLDHITAQQKAVYVAARRIVTVGVDVSRWVAQGMPAWTTWRVEPAVPQTSTYMDALNRG